MGDTRHLHESGVRRQRVHRDLCPGQQAVFRRRRSDLFVERGMGNRDALYSEHTNVREQRMRGLRPRNLGLRRSPVPLTGRGLRFPVGPTAQSQKSSKRLSRGF